MKYYIQVTFCKQIFRSTISSFQSPHKFLGLEILPSYVCHSNGGVFLKSCLYKANQVHESRVEADRRADGVRLESSSRAQQSKAKFTRGEADCRADGVRLECRRDFSLRRRGWSRGGRLHPSSQNSNFVKGFYCAQLQCTNYCLLKLNNLLFSVNSNPAKIHD